MNEMYSSAFVGLVISGASDWVIKVSSFLLITNGIKNVLALNLIVLFLLYVVARWLCCQEDEN